MKENIQLFITYLFVQVWTNMNLPNWKFWMFEVKTVSPFTTISTTFLSGIFVKLTVWPSPRRRAVKVWIVSLVIRLPWYSWSASARSFISVERSDQRSLLSDDFESKLEIETRLVRFVLFYRLTCLVLFIFMILRFLILLYFLRLFIMQVLAN